MRAKWGLFCEEVAWNRFPSGTPKAETPRVVQTFLQAVAIWALEVVLMRDPG